MAKEKGEKERGDGDAKGERERVGSIFPLAEIHTTPTAYSCVQCCVRNIASAAFSPYINVMNNMSAPPGLGEPFFSTLITFSLMI